MSRAAAIATLLAAALACTACAAGDPVEIPIPGGFDVDAAREVEASGNGLWLLDGPTAAGRVLEAMGSPSSATMQARVLERIPVEQGASIDGRVVEVASSRVGQDFEAVLSVGDQHGEIIAVGDRVWLRGNEAFSARLGIEPSDAFVCRGRAFTEIDAFASLTDPVEFLRTSLIGLDIGILEPSAAETPEADPTGSVQTLVLGSGGAPIGELLVSARGAPLPERVFLEDQTGLIEADFSWSEPSEISSPEGASGVGCD